VERDETLVARTKAGNREAFGELVRRYEQRIYHLALRLLGDENDCWDVSQEVFLRAYRGIGNFRGSSTFRTWLYTIAHNIIKNRYRSSQRRTLVPLDDRHPDGRENEMDHLVRKEQAALLRAAIDELPYKQRMALTLRMYDGLSHREIGDVLGCSEGAAKVNFHHAIANLREKLLPVRAKEGENDAVRL
jgi:RNA polymerase sigma-70 factor (ECF subfamily)